MQPILPIQPIQVNHQNNDPSDIVGALNGLIAALNTSAVQNQQLMTLGHHLQNCINYADGLVQTSQTFNNRLAEQQAAVANYQEIFRGNAGILNAQREYGQQQVEHMDLLTDALNTQEIALETIFRDLHQLGTQRVRAQLDELIGDMRDRVEHAEDVKQKRNIAIVASLVFLAASTCLLPVVPALGAAGVGCMLPGFKYARQSDLEGKKEFKFGDFVKHIVVGGAIHLSTSFVVGPIFAELGKKIAAAHVAGAGAYTVIDTLLVEAISKTTSQAVLNATGMLLRKKLLGETISRSEIFYCMVSGSFGAAASFGVEKYADGIADVVGRVFLKGVAGFVNSAVAVGTDNLLHGNNWSENLMQEGAEGFFWSIVYQTADEIRQYRVKKAEFDKTKKDIVDEINKQKLPEDIKKKLLEDISKANSLDDINTILNDVKREALIKEIQERKNLSQEKKDEIIQDLRQKNLGLSDTIKKIYTKQIEGTDLPKEIKDKLLDTISKAQNPDEIKHAINDALKDIQDEIHQGKLEGKTWGQVKEEARKWIKDLIDRGYHPSGDHLPDNMWKDPVGLEILVERVLKHVQTGERTDIVVFTHHHHRAHIEINGYQMVRYEYDNHISKNIRHGKLGGLGKDHRKGEREFENKIVKPKELAPLRNQLNALKAAKDSCESIVKNLREIQENPGSSSAGLKKAADKLKEVAVTGLSSDQLKKIYNNLIKKMDEAKKASVSPVKLNFFRSPWIGTPGQPVKAVNFEAGIRNPRPVNPIAAIRAPEFQLRPVGAIRPVAGIQQANIAAVGQPPVLPTPPVLHQMQLLGPVAPVALEELARITRRTRHIARLENQIAHCATGKSGRAKKLQLQNVLHHFKNS